MEKEREIADRLSALLKEDLIDLRIPRSRRVFATLKGGALKKTVRHLMEESGFRHISTITGVDAEDKIELIYHLANEGSISISLKLLISKAKPEIESITSLIQGAVLYEREVHDLLGVEFKGHPNLSRLILPDDWPQKIYPLRKELSVQELRDITTRKEKGGRSS